LHTIWIIKADALNIIIAGCGKVGFSLANTLSIAHNVFVIDKNEEAVSKLQESLDILTIVGDIKNPNIYKNIDYESIDLFIAVTSSDEANIISSLVIDGVLNVKKKIVRTKSSYYEQSNIKERLNIQKLIMPSLISSKSIKSLIKYPKINNIKSFKNSDLKLISIYATRDFPKEELDELLHVTKERILGIEREKDFFITSTTQILKGDLIYILVKEENVSKVSNIFNKELPNEINNCVVFGCDKMGIEIARILIENKKSVKIIEKDIKACDIAQEGLNGKAEIINSLYHDDEDIFIDEGLQKADFFISTYKSDEYNIIKCLEAKEFGIKKVVATNNESAYYNLMHSLNIIPIRGPKVSAYHRIIEHINSSNVIIEKYFCGGKGVIFLRKIYEKSRLLGRQISLPKIEGALFYLIKNNKIESIQNCEITKNSAIVAVCIKEQEEKIRQWLYEL